MVISRKRTKLQLEVLRGLASAYRVYDTSSAIAITPVLSCPVPPSARPSLTQLNSNQTNPTQAKLNSASLIHDP